MKSRFHLLMILAAALVCLVLGTAQYGIGVGVVAALMVSASAAPVSVCLYANEFSRNIQDASINPATFTLPAAASASTTSNGIDLGTDVHKSESIELELSVPALTDTMVPSTRTTTYIIETSAASNFATIARTIASKTFTGAGSGVAAAVLRARLPSDCERYVRAKITHGASTTDSSAVSATFSARF